MVKMLIKLEKRVRADDLTENFNKKIYEKNQSELKNTVSEMKNTLEGVSGRLKDVASWISDLEDRVVESNQIKHPKKKKCLTNEDR